MLKAWIVNNALQEVRVPDENGIERQGREGTTFTFKKWW
jgi:hypothetical protein